MSKSNFDDVGDFHEKFGLANATHHPPAPTHISPELQDFRLKFLREELDEIEEGYQTGDLAKIFDGLIDLVYVALGTAHVHRFPWTEGWTAVQSANMAKTRALRKEDSVRGSTFDVVKPLGWKPPDIAGILEKHQADLIGALDGPAHNIKPDRPAALCAFVTAGKDPCVALRVVGSDYCVVHAPGSKH